MLGQGMFATAKTDFQPYLRRPVAETGRRVRNGGFREPHPGQCLVQKPLLAGTQRMAALTPVKPVRRCLYIHRGRHMSENPAPAAAWCTPHGMITPLGRGKNTAGAAMTGFCKQSWQAPDGLRPVYRPKQAEE
ncbi:hypothetical protein Gxy13693_022_086 [Komagataeibacter xylinus NBRC 13693]|uniref:Uncharacterized protein n=1 Tax=Komagataeibacter xylinus NBRC 13693 TaxID=1234668 RepID=A0A0D6Q834_KOMXY|nr:hypothetical protein Gxy13693_022_086 [Komagataeibacter xylinus NBRC 13693]